MPPELSQLARELLTSLPWSIVLPAGCGKTELIAAMAASIDAGSKPLLVLTHTNAGVDVVRKRFAKYGVRPDKARVFTLDTWAKLFDDHFPQLGGTANVPEGTDMWLAAQLRTGRIFDSPHIGDVLTATYSAVIVDEYQDCSDIQHALVVAMSQHIPVGVLGDPLQGIFAFGAGVVDWPNVEVAFAPKALTPTPHRWATRNPNLGSWLLALRPSLVVGATINLSANGSPITWRTSDWRAEGAYCIAAANGADSQKQIVALRQQPAQCYKFARGLLGKFHVAEEIECKAVKALAVALDEGNGGKLAAAAIKFVKACCIGCPSAFNPALISAYSNGNPKVYNRGNQLAAVYDALNALITSPTPQNTKDAITSLRGASQRVFRWEAWRVALQVLDELTYSGGSASKGLQDVRNRSRYGGQASTRHTVSRTLLVKGQEYDECIILGADGMNARNLYVALSRGIDKVTVFSAQPTITITDY